VDMLENLSKSEENWNKKSLVLKPDFYT
jgi:hypothetical protein